MLRNRWWAGICWAVWAVAAPAAPFAGGDRVAFVGDSITRGGLYHADTLLFYATRYPDRAVRGFNCGHSGGTAGDTLRRLGWDVLDRRPTAATVMFGMNDLGGGFLTNGMSVADSDAKIRARVAAVTTNYVRLIEALEKAGVRLTLLAPSPYDDTAQLAKPAEARKNAALAAWTVRVRELAAQHHAEFADFHTLLTALNAAQQQKDPAATLVGADRIHPGPVGHFLMAYALLKAQGVTPVVSRVVLDAAPGTPPVVENGQLSKCRVQADRAAFDLLERALPYPVPDEARAALALVPFMDELDRETLVVRGLQAGRYDLRIDGAPAAVFTAPELAAGVNLAACTNTPMYRQARGVQQANDLRHKLESSELRGLAFVRHAILEPAKVNADDDAAVEKCLKDFVAKHTDPKDFGRTMALRYPLWRANRDQTQQQIAACWAAMDRERQPKPHHFEITKHKEP